MPNFQDSLEEGARRAACRIMGAQSQLIRAFKGYSQDQPLGILRYYPDFAQLGYQLLCDLPAPPEPPPPFNGGQCPTLYSVTAQATVELQNPPSSEQTTATTQLPGPIRGITQRVIGSSDQIVILFTNLDGTLGETTIFGTTRPSGQFTAFSITQVTRVDGLPDDCGNPVPPRPDPPPPGSNTDTDIVNWDDSTGSPQTNNINVTLGISFTNNVGDIIIPVEVNADIDVSATVNFNLSTGGVSIAPSLNIDAGNRNGNTNVNNYNNTTVTISPPTSPIAPDSPVDDPREERTIRGVIVTVTSIDALRASIIGQFDNPDIYVPRLGNVQFRCRIGTTGTTAWTSDIAVKNERNLIECPWQWGALEVRGTPEPGITWTLTPVYEISDEPPQFTT